MSGDTPDGYEPINPSQVASGGCSTSFETLVGPLYRKSGATPDRTQWGFRAEPRHCNPYGVIHGGMLTTFADTMMGSLVFHAIDGAPCATISLTTDFIGAGKAGDWITGSAEILRRGRAVAFVRAEIKNGDRLLMNASGAWAIIAANASS